MGYSAYAVGVVGLHFKPGVVAAKLYTEEEVRACNHIMRDTAKFCEKCGAEAFKLIHKAIPEYNEDTEDPRLCGYKLVAWSAEDYDSPAFIVYHWSDHVDVGEIALFPTNMLERLPAIQEEMKKKLAPLGLWDKKAFGVHIFLYENC